MELAPLGAEAVNTRLLDKGLAEKISQVYLYLGSFVAASVIRDSTGVIQRCPIGQPTPLYLMAIMTRRPRARVRPRSTSTPAKIWRSAESRNSHEEQSGVADLILISHKADDQRTRTDKMRTTAPRPYHCAPSSSEDTGNINPVRSSRAHHTARRRIPRTRNSPRHSVKRNSTCPGDENLKYEHTQRGGVEGDAARQERTEIGGPSS
ncbi:hypothetical protein EDB85DRAFT_1992395 [Lactarius pseudohatsudake]|nr:hypothetical protein EDB85DRAFT_2013064 [Lactarius pseudohatsudake]KAH9023171.1 hypothetical protein EDB85DRAFT_1992395 [Lactarius pseudohatsudake]